MVYCIEWCWWTSSKGKLLHKYTSIFFLIISLSWLLPLSSPSFSPPAVPVPVPFSLLLPSPLFIVLLILPSLSLFLSLFFFSYFPLFNLLFFFPLLLLISPPFPLILPSRILFCYFFYYPHLTGIITPYTDQVQEIKKRLHGAGLLPSIEGDKRGSNNIAVSLDVEVRRLIQEYHKDVAGKFT